MSADECRRKLSLREVAAWSFIIQKENELEIEKQKQPLLNEIYLARVAMEVRSLAYGMANVNKSLTLSDFIIKLDNEEKQEDKISTLTKQGQGSLASKFKSSIIAPQVPDFEKWQQQLMKS